MVRQPAVAGAFYPRERERMEAELRRLVRAAEVQTSARALVVPHAGWAYSGRVAGEVYGRVALPRLAVILGPNHAGHGAPAAIACEGRWELPGGALPIAASLARRILAGSLALEEDARAHLHEHSIEVQLPFLGWLRADIAFVPITLWHSEPAVTDDVGRAIATALRDLDEPAIVIASTDLNHYEPQAVGNEKDRRAIEAIMSLDPALLFATVAEHQISMCGAAPTAAMLAAVRELGGDTAELIRYETSGDVSGAYERVVGYAGLVVR